MGEIDLVGGVDGTDFGVEGVGVGIDFEGDGFGRMIVGVAFGVITPLFLSFGSSRGVMVLKITAAPTLTAMANTTLLNMTRNIKKTTSRTNGMFWVERATMECS